MRGLEASLDDLVTDMIIGEQAAYRLAQTRVLFLLVFCSFSEIYLHVTMLFAPVIVSLLYQANRSNALKSRMALSQGNFDSTKLRYDFFELGSLAFVPTTYLKPILTQTTVNFPRDKPVWNDHHNKQFP